MKNHRSPDPAAAPPGSALLYAATLAVALLALPALTGCADTGGIAPQARLRDTATLVAPGTADVAVAPDWWRAFGDAQLDALVQQALDNGGRDNATAVCLTAHGYRRVWRLRQG